MRTGICLENRIYKRRKKDDRRKGLRYNRGQGDSVFSPILIGAKKIRTMEERLNQKMFTHTCMCEKTHDGGKNAEYISV